MARPSKNEAPDLRRAIDITSVAIDRLVCPPGKDQAFMRDAKAPGLRVRVTAAGSKSFVFEGKLDRKTIRRTIGDVRAWKLDDARTEANRLRVTLDQGIDPREVDRAAVVEKVAQPERMTKAEVTVGEAWEVYLAARKDAWGDRHYADHQALAKAGGKKVARGTRGKGETIEGPLYMLMPRWLSSMTSEVVEAWAMAQGKARPTYGRLAWRCLKAFLSWCAEERAYAALVPANAANTRKSRDAFGKASIRKDVLLKEQLPAWFAAVQQFSSPVVSAYLQTLLLIGSRRGELMELKWTDLNVQWRGMTIRDKVEGDRQIPLTPYVWHLLRTLPRRNEFVFSSTRNPKSHLADPNAHMNKVCAVAGLEGLTLHGLRRSFKSLTEWLDIPAGVVAQIMGHKPGAIAGKHYTVRPLDLLRVHHEKIEAWILEHAKVSFDPAKEDTRRSL